MGNLLLLNARVVTMDPAHPRAEAVAVRGGRIACVGSNDACRRVAPASATVIDCRGMTVLPGFVDAHLHLTAYAAALRAVDCSAARSIEDIVALIRERAAALPPGTWVRAAGYDESRLAEARHPTRWDLDRATSEHPVRLIHRSGHALVLNSRGLALVGITIASEEPPGGVIDRRLSDGEPTGLLLEMNDLVARAVPPLPRAELVAGMREAGTQLLASGITAVQDLTHTNGPGAADFLAALAAESGFAPRLLPAAEGWPGDAAGLAGDPARPVKVMVRETGERPLPDVPELAAIIRACHAHGRAVAVHAVERRTVAAVVEAFARAGVRGGEVRHRIEHASVCPPELAARIAALGLSVVSNPVFLFESGDRYLRSVAPQDLPHLYDVTGLLAAGVRVAVGSDAPVAPPDALAGVRAAVTRTARSGEVLPGTGLDPHRAAALVTAEAAAVAGAEGELGRIAPGMAADLALLTAEPHRDEARVAMTVIGGEVRWRREPSEGGRL